MSAPERRYRAGDSLPDHCRACKIVREHRVLAVDGEGRLLRVVCGFCGSQHNYRGGERRERPAPAAPQFPAVRLVRDGRVVPAAPAPRKPVAARPEGGDPEEEIVSERERRFPAMATDGSTDLEMMLRRVIREETGLTPVTLAERWRGGDLVLRSPRREIQEKSWPVETFFHKVVMIRNRLRTLEQQLNGSALPDDQKVKLQSYVTGCYGSLTSFNVLFSEDDDRFEGASGSSGE